MMETQQVTVMDSQVRDVISAALSHYVSFLEGQGSVQRSCGAERQAECTMRQWARTKSVLRLVEREGK